MLETRLAALDRAVSGRSLRAVAPLGEPAAVLSDGDLDFVAAPSTEAAPVRPEQPVPHAAREEPPAARAELQPIEALGTRERLLLFT